MSNFLNRHAWNREQQETLADLSDRIRRAASRVQIFEGTFPGLVPTPPDSGVKFLSNTGAWGTMESLGGTVSFSDILGLISNAQVPSTAVLQYQTSFTIDWSQLANVPGSFPTGSHAHVASDITSGTFDDARIAQSNVTQHEASLSIAWSQLTSIPSSFTPASHAHDGTDITSGTVADARLSSNIPLLNASNVFTATTPQIRIRRTGIGFSALTQTMAGLELSAAGMNASSKWTPPIKFASVDPDFTTSNPKFLAGIAGRATETYAADTHGGMAIDFFGSQNAPGTTPVPELIATMVATSAGGSVRPGNGSAALPSWSFESDPNTGVYRIGADNIGISAGGVKVFDATATDMTLSAEIMTLATSGAGEMYLDSDYVIVPKGELMLTSNHPICYFIDEDAAADTGIFYLSNTSSRFRLLGARDDWGAFVTPIEVLRSGMTITEINLLGTAIKLNGMNFGTAATATAALDAFSSTLKGLAPASGGGTTNFLRADGTWAAPPGGGGGGTVVWSKGAAWVRETAIEAPAVNVRVHVPFAGTIKGVTVLTGGGTGSCVIDVWKDSYANYPPTVADSITASAKPTISSGIKYQDTTLTGWTTSVSAGDVLTFVLDSTSTFTEITITLDIEETL